MTRTTRETLETTALSGLGTGRPLNSLKPGNDDRYIDEIGLEVDLMMASEFRLMSVTGAPVAGRQRFGFVLNEQRSSCHESSLVSSTKAEHR